MLFQSPFSRTTVRLFEKFGGEFVFVLIVIS